MLSKTDDNALNKQNFGALNGKKFHWDLWVLSLIFRFLNSES